MKRSETLQQFMDRELAGVDRDSDEYLSLVSEKCKEYYAAPKPKPKTLDEQDAEYGIGDHWFD